MDYRILNEATVKDQVLIPTIDELLDELKGISKLDFRVMYHHIRMDPDVVEKTTFCTNESYYEFFVMPLELCNAPATFQSIMNRMYKPHLRIFVIVFFYDTSVYSETLDWHLTHLEKILTILTDDIMFLKKSKCVFR